MSGENPQMMEALNSAVNRSNVNATNEFEWPRDELGRPMMRVTSAAAELIPTQPFGNVTIGPITVTAFIQDPICGSDDEWKQEARDRIRRVQEVCEESVAEERQTVALLMRSRVAATERS